MTLSKILVLAAIQGATELLPVSEFRTRYYCGKVNGLGPDHAGSIVG